MADTTFAVEPQLRATFWRQDWAATVSDELHRASPDLVDVIAAAVMDKITHVDTGTLASSVIGDANTDNTADPELAFIYEDEQAQMDAWGRIYVQYIEGGTLGDTSPTISSPDEMFERTADEDLSLFEDWAVTALEGAGLRLTSGTGAPALGSPSP
jgi:hypothetical protein